MAVFLGACGDDSSGGGDGSNKSWSPTEISNFVDSCTNTLLTLNYDAVYQEAYSYCTCARDATASRYSAAEADQKGGLITQELIDDGTLAACVEQSGLNL